jgi:hypothetical protein
MTRASALPLASALSMLLALPAASRAGDFEQGTRPVLEKYCNGCHGGKRPKAGINLARFQDEVSVKRNPDLWQQVIEVIAERTMPPEGKPSPSEEERQRASQGIQALLDSIDHVRDPGPALIQRLTREQYNNTIRDLLGVDSRPADAFPADGGGGAGFDNNASTLFVPPILMEKYLAAAAEVLDRADPARYLIARPGPDLTREDAARICLRDFASRAFRRPVADEEVERLLRLFRYADRRGDPFEQAVKLALRAVLVSPNFLFLVERERPEAEGFYRVGPYELASRLSYFLWSSMPDKELFDLAAGGRLHEPAVLDRQVRRMLADPKSRALARDFAGQWLRVGSLANAAEPDRRRFPDYTPELRDAMVEEAVTFFHALLREDRPVLDLIDADYTYVNEPLAKHYGIEGVTGPEFRRVELKDPNRGGVLGMAAVLTLTSYPRRTSPVLRGKWVLEELLGTPPPPPPPMVKALPQDDRPRNGLTFRQRLEKHRSDASCASCHAKMDPLGFGLENFDPIGRWRTQVADQPVDASGELTTGEEFQGPAELKRILKDQKRDLFVRNLSGRLLSYALRRGLEYYDQPIVKDLAAKLAAGDYRSTVLVAEVAKSFPFQYRRNEPIVEAKK